MVKLLYKASYKRKKAVFIHILCWLIFSTYEIIVAGILAGFVPFYHYLLFYLLNIGLFYFHSLFLLNYISVNPKVNLWRIPLFVILELLVYLTISLSISLCLNKYVYHDLQQAKFLNYKYLPTAVYRGILFILYGTGYYFLINYIRKTEKTLTQAIENEKLQNELLRAEQDFLRAQINPHLLFNTLSFIKYAAKKKPEEADEAVMRLSSIMSFALDNNSQSILLNREIDQVENIIGLNQLRYNRTLNINFKKNLENDQATIIPIILLTLAENVFKHGNLLDSNHPAEINIEATKEYVLLQTRNLPSRDNQIKSHHTGLTNMRSRLDQFYKDKYHFDYGLDRNIFKVDIKIYL